mgnify:CR=1 FL=1
MQSPTSDCMLPFADRKPYAEHKLMGGGVPSPGGLQLNSPGLVPRACEILSSSLVPCPGLFFLFLLLFLEHPWGHWIQKCAPRRIPGGWSAAPRCIPVMGRDFLYTQKTSGFTLRFAFGWRANGPRPPTYPPYPPTYGFMAQILHHMHYFFVFLLKYASLNIPYPRVIYRTLE